MIVLVRLEEERALFEFTQSLERSGRGYLTWDMAEGYRASSIVPGATATPAEDPITALGYVDTTEGEELFVFEDFHDCWDHPQVKRKLRSVAQRAFATAIV
jgi:hypothetical protein